VVQANLDDVAHEVVEPLSEGVLHVEQLLTVGDAHFLVFLVNVFVLRLNLNLLDVLQFRLLSEYFLLSFELQLLQSGLFFLEVLDLFQNASQGNFLVFLVFFVVEHVQVHSDLFCSHFLLFDLEVVLGRDLSVV
jgi:hypothetical protein